MCASPKGLRVQVILFRVFGQRQTLLWALKLVKKNYKSCELKTKTIRSYTIYDFLFLSGGLDPSTVYVARALRLFIRDISVQARYGCFDTFVSSCTLFEATWIPCDENITRLATVLMFHYFSHLAWNDP